jgi:uncharacterized protein (DUF433 family)
VPIFQLEDVFVYAILLSGGRARGAQHSITAYRLQCYRLQCKELFVDTIQSIDLIVTNPDVRQGQPCIAGTGLRVADIAMASLFHKRSPDEIAADYELSLAQVHAALAYYYAHKDEIDADIRSQIKTARELREKRIGGQASLLPG